MLACTAPRNGHVSAAAAAKCPVHGNRAVRVAKLDLYTYADQYEYNKAIAPARRIFGDFIGDLTSDIKLRLTKDDVGWAWGRGAVSVRQIVYSIEGVEDTYFVVRISANVGDNGRPDAATLDYSLFLAKDEAAAKDPADHESYFSVPVSGVLVDIELVDTVTNPDKSVPNVALSHLEEYLVNDAGHPQMPDAWSSTVARARRLAMYARYDVNPRNEPLIEYLERETDDFARTPSDAALAIGHAMYANP